MKRPRSLRSNRDLLVAIHIITTGYDVCEGDLVSVTLMPMNEHLRISDEHSIFTVKFSPTFFGKYDPNVKRSDGYKNYLPAKKAGLETLKKWFEGLQLDCRITLLGYDLPQQVEFLVDWFEGKEEYLKIFSPITRDILMLELFRRDCEAYVGEGDNKPPSLLKLIKRLSLNYEIPNSPQRICLVLAEIYRTLVYEAS